MMTSYVWHCFCIYCTKIQVLITFQYYNVTLRLVGHIQCWKQDQKYKTKLD